MTLMQAHRVPEKVLANFLDADGRLHIIPFEQRYSSWSCSTTWRSASSPA